MKKNKEEVVRDPHEIAMDEIKLGFGVALVIVLSLAFCLAGCAYNSEEMTSIRSTDTSTWVYEGDNSLVAVSHTFIKDGDVNGMDIVEFVDLDNGNMYLYTSKYLGGFGCTMIPKYADSEGNIQVYEDLEVLRKLHNYKVED